MKNHEMIIDKHFNTFIESKKKYSEVRFSYSRKFLDWFLQMNYTPYYIDELEGTGFIFYKPYWGRYARLYMFKGKDFTPKPYPRTGFLEWKKKFRNMCRDACYNPDRKMRKKAEKRVKLHIIIDISKFILLAALLFTILLLIKGK